MPECMWGIPEHGNNDNLNDSNAKNNSNDDDNNINNNQHHHHRFVCQLVMSKITVCNVVRCSGSSAGHE